MSEQLYEGSSSQGPEGPEGPEISELQDMPDFNHLATFSHRERYTSVFMGQTIQVDSSDWRDTTLLKFQLLAGFLNFIVFGLAEQTIGTAIPHLEEYYQIGDFHVGMIFLASTFGYFVMALISEILHRSLGVRGLGIMGALSMSAAYFVINQKPRFAVFVLCYFFSGIGFGTLDATFNGWMANLVDSNQILGILHGCYGIGCMISPPVLTKFMQRKINPWLWNDYYLVLSALAAFNVVFFGYIFRYETPAKFRFMLGLLEARKRLSDKKSADLELDESVENSSREIPEDQSDDLNIETESASLSQSLRSKSIWIFSISMFIYVGAEVAFGTWLITFLTRIKHMEFQAASYMATTFWTGLTGGRICLGLITSRYFSHELTANFFYVALSLVLHLLFCLLIFTPLVAFQFVNVFFSGIFVGPIFPHLISTAVKVLPVKFHATGVGFICAFGGGGAAAVPFLVGLVAQASDTGLRLYPFVVTILYGILLVLWAQVARKYRHVWNKPVRQPDIGIPE